MLRACLPLAALALLLVVADARAASPSDELHAEPAPVAPVRAAASPTWDRSKEGPAVGFTMGGGFFDNGVGAAVIAGSPTIGRWARVDVGIGPMLFPRRAVAGEQVFDPYGTGRLVLELGPDFLTALPIRPYLVAGPELFLLPSALSRQSVAVGALAALGLEVALPRAGGTTAPTTWFIEVGGRLADPRADALPGAPSIGPRIFGSAGFRVYL